MAGQTVPPDVRAWFDSQAAAVRENRRFNRAFDMDRLTHDDYTAKRVNIDDKLDSALSACARFDSGHPSATRSAPPKPVPAAPKIVKAAAPVTRANAAPAIDVNTRINALSWELHQAQQRLDAANQADALNPPEPQVWNPADHQRNLARTAAAGGQDGGKVAAVVDVEGFSGRPIKTYYGDIGVMMAPFSNPRRYVARFLTGGR